MRVHCVLEKEKYSTRVFHDDFTARTKVEVTIDDDDLYDDMVDVSDVIIVLEEKGGDT